MNTGTRVELEDKAVFHKVSLTKDTKSLHEFEENEEILKETIESQEKDEEIRKEHGIKSKFAKLFDILKKQFFIVLCIITIIIFDVGSIAFFVIQLESDLIDVLPIIATPFSRVFLVVIELSVAFLVYDVRRRKVKGIKKLVTYTLALIVILFPSVFLGLNFFFGEASIVKTITFLVLSLISHLLLFYLADKLFHNIYENSLKYKRIDLSNLRCEIEDLKTYLIGSFIAYDRLIDKLKELSDGKITIDHKLSDKVLDVKAELLGSSPQKP